MIAKDDEPRVDTNVLVDSKREYIEQLERCLSVPVFAALKNVLQDAMNVADAKDLDDMECFSKLLEEVPSWNADIVEEETREVLKTAPYLKELLKAYFVCASMILGSIRKSNSSDQRLRVKVPTCERFFHSIVKMMAVDIADDMPHYVSQTDMGDYKLNKRQTMKSIAECIKTSLHGFMPIDDILKDYMDGIMGEDQPRAREEKDVVEVENKTKSVKLGNGVLRPARTPVSYDDEDEEQVVVEEEEDF
eukprot:jgi/Mesvir1/26539/Mv16194-RA.1